MNAIRQTFREAVTFCKQLDLVESEQMLREEATLLIPSEYLAHLTSSSNSGLVCLT
jgi:hypothetical protein